MEQDILIYIDEKEKLDASVAANAFAHKDVKNRAYINTLGAELALKYLVSENIDVSQAKNIHSIKKILEETDIADIILPNIHIDVRVVFDENAIFIPKSHFEYNLTPDIYLVFNLSSDRSHVRFLGFFEPKLINKNNANSEYYFIEKEKLNSANNLVDYINTHKSNYTQELSDSDFETSERFIVAMSDNDISETDKKYLLNQLIKSAELRDKFIEYENFETLSYKAMNDPLIEKKEIQNVETFEEISTPIDTPELEGLPIEDSFIQDPIEDMEAMEDVISTENFNDDLETVEPPVIDTTEEVPQDDIIPIDGETPELPLDGVLSAGEGIGEVALDNINLPDIDMLNMDELPTEAPEQVEETIENLSTDNELPALDEINIPQEAAAIDSIPETIDLDGLELPDMSEANIGLEEPSIDVSGEEIVDFGNIELPQTEEAEIEVNNSETINFDNIELPQAEESEVIENNDETIDFGNIELPQAENTPDTQVIESISLDDIDMVDSLDNVPTDDIQPELLSMDSITEQTGNIDAIESDAMNFNEVPDIIESTEDFDINSFENNQTDDNILTSDIAPNEDPISFEELPEIIETDDLSYAEEAQSQTDSSFGKNLLENLSIEDIDVSDNYNESGDISSNDLLSQIDDVLNSSATETNIDDASLLEDIEDVVNDGNGLNVLFNEENQNLETPLQEETQNQQIPGANVYNKNKTSNKKQTLVATTLLIALAVSAGIFLMKNKNETTNDIEQPLPINNTASETMTSPLTTEDILETNTPQPAPVNNAEVKLNKQEVKELQNTPTKTVKSDPHLDVNRLVWDVPDVLSQSSKIQSYLRTAGKSIKISLSTDLLLATEYAYTNQVKVGLTLSSDGSIQDSKILSSSGSSQIDNIVLQSVKDTLNVVKPPSGEIKSPNFKLNLIIYL